MRTNYRSNFVIQMVYVSCCLLAWILLVCPFGLTEGRSISDEDFFPMSIQKRNCSSENHLGKQNCFKKFRIESEKAWWSKKSLENVPDFQKENTFHENQKEGCDDVINIFKCYAEMCVPDLVECSRSSDDVYEMCKIEHNLCAARCFDADSNIKKK